MSDIRDESTEPIPDYEDDLPEQPPEPDVPQRDDSPRNDEVPDA